MTKHYALLAAGCLSLLGCKDAIPTQADYKGASIGQAAATTAGAVSSCAKTAGFWQGEAGEIVILQSGEAFLVDLAGRDGRATFRRMAAAYCQGGVLVTNQQIIGNIAYNERDSNLLTALGTFYPPPAQ